VKSLATLVALAVAVTVVVSVATGGDVRALAATAAQCSDSQYAAVGDPSNPLGLPSAPGSNPLNGADLFVDGPRHGDAAGAIARLLGVDPTTYADDYSWASLQQDISPGGSLYGKLAGNPQLAKQVALLAEIADQPETQNLSEYSQGGGPGAAYDQIQKIFCHNLTADPDTVPVFSTLFIDPHGQVCPPLSALVANAATFKRQIGETAAGTGLRPAVFLLELNAVGGSGCLSPAELTVWEGYLRYEIEHITALPHTVVYVDGGVSDEDSAAYVAKVLDDVCVVKTGGRLTNVCARLRGFYVNATHFEWTITEIDWANKIVALLRALITKQTGQPYTAHYIVNTAQNGRGPKLNPHPAQQGIEDLCNPPGRGLGRAPTTATDPTSDGHAFPLADAFLWTGVPGRSHNSDCHPGDAPTGVFDMRFALELAGNASDQLGPSALPPLSALPPPVLGRSADLVPVSGTVLVKLPAGGDHAVHGAQSAAPAGSLLAAAALSKGRGFVPLTQARQVPLGTQVDARAGALNIVLASAHKRQSQQARLGGALFSIAQARTGPAKGLATFALQEGAFAGAPSYASCTTKRAVAESRPGAQIATVSPKVLQTLHASDQSGQFRTRGRYSSATVRGTVWDTIDRCDGTLTVVHRGTVSVLDFARRRTVVVHAGHSYLASAIGRPRK